MSAPKPGFGFREGYARVTDAIADNGAFSSDTFVDMPDADDELVPASRWNTIVTDDTPDHVNSEIQLSVLSDGAPVVALDLLPGQILAPVLTSNDHPAYAFRNFPKAGIRASNGVGTFGDLQVQVAGDTIFAFDWQLGMATAGFGYPYHIGFDFLRGLGQNGVNGNLQLFGDKNFQMGAPGAIDVAATVGYFLIPYSDGPPTGIPAPLPAGKAALHWDKANKQIYLYDTAWVKTAVLT
jgi:hypothetical protein